MARYDLRDPAFLAEPGPMLAAMRAEGALVRVRLPVFGRIWVTTTDAAARKLLKDTKSFARDPTRAGRKPMQRLFWWMPRSMAPLMQNIILKDGADHRRLRSLVDKAFARTAIDDMRPRIETMADTLLDQIDPSQPVDIVAAYTRKLPLLAICELLGIPEKDRRKIAGLIGHISGPTHIWSIFLGFLRLGPVIRHFRADFEIVRQTGRPGLIRELVRAEEEGDRLSDDELLAMVFTLFVAGHETTVHLITDAILGLIDAPDARATLQTDPGRLPLAIEEFMRFFSPVMMTKAHFVTLDHTFEGVDLKRGEMVLALLIGANHDAARFDAPEALNIARRPNAHLGFGHGPHVCLGMQLARAEAEVGLRRLFARFPNLRLAGPRDKIYFSRRIGLRGLPRLDLILD